MKIMNDTDIFYEDYLEYKDSYQICDAGKAKNILLLEKEPNEYISLPLFLKENYIHKETFFKWLKEYRESLGVAVTGKVVVDEIIYHL